MVTSVPRSDIIEANSHPMAPPPMTTADAGSCCERQQLVGGDDPAAVDLEARDGAGHRAGGQQDVGAVSSTSPELPPVTRTTWSACRRADAVVDRDLAALQQARRGR